MRLLRPFALALALAVSPLLAPVSVEAAPATKGTPQPEIRPFEPLVVETRAGHKHRFRVEVARTERQRAFGMMYRTSMAVDRGMLFLFSPPQPVSFWMRNTLLPLDMLFIRADGRIANIIESAEPETLDLRQSDGPVAAVLEVRGGLARQLGIAAGDRVAHPWLGKRRR